MSKQLQDAINSINNGHAYIDVVSGGEEIILDGCFNIQLLRELVRLLEQHTPPPIPAPQPTPANAVADQQPGRLTELYGAGTTLQGTPGNLQNLPREPEFPDGPDEAGFKGPRPWNNFNESAPPSVGSDQELWRHLRNLMGYVENGSSTVVALFQDDATREYHVKVGIESRFGAKPVTHFGATLAQALLKHPRNED